MQNFNISPLFTFLLIPIIIYTEGEICNKKLKTLCSIHSNINDDDIIIEDSENEEL